MYNEQAGMTPKSTLRPMQSFKFIQARCMAVAAIACSIFFGVYTTAFAQLPDSTPETLYVYGIETHAIVQEAQFIHIVDTSVSLSIEPQVIVESGERYYTVDLVLDVYNYSNTIASDVDLEWEFSHSAMYDFYGNRRTIPFIPPRHSLLNAVIRIPEQALIQDDVGAVLVLKDEKLAEEYRFSILLDYSITRPRSPFAVLSRLDRGGFISDFAINTFGPVYTAISFVGAAAQAIVETISSFVAHVLRSGWEVLQLFFRAITGRS
jgi:hypothetical protein